MIQVKNITFSHTGEPLYKNASCSVPKNKKAGLVGLNGSGKSTLFNLLLQLEWPDSGTITVEGNALLVPQEVKHDERQSRAKTIREYLTQVKPNNDQTLHELLSSMEMQNISLSTAPAALSGGQKTKLAILFAVLAQPQIF